MAALQPKPTNEWTCKWRGFQITAYAGGYRPKVFVHPKSGTLNRWHDIHESLAYANEITKAVIIWINVFRDSISLIDYLNRSNI